MRQKRTVLITGASRGIGLALARQLSARGDSVIAVVRSSSKELDALDLRVERGIDVTDESALRELSGKLKQQKLGWLICNAGVLTHESLDQFDAAAIQRQFEVNALGPLRCVAALRSHLEAGSKVGLITSRMGSVSDNTSGSMYGYRMSKAALNMAGVSLAHDLKPLGVSVALLHPGYVKTELTRGSGSLTPDEAAQGLIARLDELALDQSGGFWHQNGERLPW
jgi:NAD(P)-dependent dehydrogenase (short-subunit alcohol dehydrogenase family)